MVQTMIVAALVAVGQPPPAKPVEVKGVPLKDPLAETLTRALQTHPDIRVAEAELQVAAAKVAQAKLKVSQQVTAAHADRDRMRSGVEVATAALVRVDRLLATRAVSQEELVAAQSGVAVARANLAKAEAELNALVGPATVAVEGYPIHWKFTAVTNVVDGRRFDDTVTAGTVRVRGVSFSEWTVTPGSPAEKLKAALDKPVKFGGAPGIGIKAGYEAVLKAAGADLHIRVPAWEDPAVFKDKFQVKIGLPAAEYPLATWLELIGDAYAQAVVVEEKLPEFDRPARYELYVREYGLLVSEAKLAPPGAVTVSELWKQLRADKAALAKDKQEKK